MSWTQGDKPVEVSVCLIIKRRKNKGRWEYETIEEFKGEWNDLIFELFERYGQFREEIAHLSRKSAQHERLDKVADEYARRDAPHEFMLPDGTDEWYVAYCKPAIFRIDADGGLR